MTRIMEFLCAGLLGAATSLAGAPQQAVRGLYTAEQAARGKALYASKCAACHGTDLRGTTAPPLAGPAFATNWGPVGPLGLGALRENAFTLDDLFFVMSTTMPPGAVKSVSDEERASILAYILQQNGYPEGKSALVPDSTQLKKTKVESWPLKAGMKSEPPPRLIRGDAKSVPALGGPSQDELNNAFRSTQDWLYHTHDYSGSRFVALDQINSKNAEQLRAVCAFQVGEISNFQTGPIVYQSIMYVTTAHTTVALDAANCRPKWRHTWEPKDRDLPWTNRGVALKDGRVVRGTPDGYLLELNAQTGKLIWARKVANPVIGENFTKAPLIFEDLILIGPAFSETAISGWVGAFRLSDGSEVWKFKLVPGAEEAGSKSWPNPEGIKLGGGGTWTPFSFDLEKTELYVAVGNPAPDFAAGLRPGDNLYSNSLIALDIHTGKLRWYKQMVPNDSHDWDLTQVSPLFNITVGGRERSLVATVGKDGVLRAVDRASHDIVYETPVTTLKNVDKPATPDGVLACPGVFGGVEWNGPSFNPGTNLLYVGAVDWCTTFYSSETVRYIPGRLYMGGTWQADQAPQGWITALDAATGQTRWRYRSPRPVVAAVTTTSGNVVFSGELTGDFIVLDAQSGDVLYRFNTGGSIGGGIVTYEVERKQYVALMSGRPSPLWIDQNSGAPTVFLFALP